MMTAKAPATHRLLLRATISVTASQLGGDGSSEGGELSTVNNTVTRTRGKQLQLEEERKHHKLFV